MTRCLAAVLQLRDQAVQVLVQPGAVLLLEGPQVLDPTLQGRPLGFTIPREGGGILPGLPDQLVGHDARRLDVLVGSLLSQLQHADGRLLRRGRRRGDNDDRSGGNGWCSHCCGVRSSGCGLSCRDTALELNVLS